MHGSQHWITPKRVKKAKQSREGKKSFSGKNLEILFWLGYKDLVKIWTANCQTDMWEGLNLTF